MSFTHELPAEGDKRQAGRKRTTTEQGKMMRNRERRRLAREQAAESEEMVMEYRRQMEQREQRTATVNTPERQMQRAIDRGLVKRVAGVLSAEGLDFTMRTGPSNDERSMAWTDFENIDITYGVFTDAKGDPDYRMIAANFRGLAFHEGGHIRWTVPFLSLVEAATGEGNTNRYNSLHKAWNILEDQRMETAVVTESPAKAKFFLPMVMEHNCPTLEMLAMNYPYIVWRKYLPLKLRRQGRKLFLQTHRLMTEALCTEMETLIRRYVLSTDPVEMLNIVTEFDALYRTYINPEIPGDASHQQQMQQGGQGEAGGDDFYVPVSPDMMDENEGEADDGAGAPDEAQEGAGEGQGAGEAGGDDEGEGDAQGDAEGESEGEGHGDGAGTSSPDEVPSGDSTDTMTDEDLEQMLQDAQDTRDADETLDHDAQAMYQAAQEFGSTLPTYHTGVNTNATLTLMADNLAYEVENAFHAATMDKAPAWVEGMSRGTININRYVTRQPGDRDFYRQWTDDDQPGFNISVSVLLDNSSSMDRSTEQLAVAGYATKRVCEKLGIPCTVTLWNTNAVLLWDTHDKVEGLPVIEALGGTNPKDALDDLFAQRFDKPVHIVLILTDGAWGGQTFFADYRTPGTFFLVLSYDRNRGSAEMRAEAIRKLGADVSLGITDLMEIPRALEHALADAVMGAY